MSLEVMSLSIRGTEDELSWGEGEKWTNAEKGGFRDFTPESAIDRS
jgi:hypothetical protein